MKRFKVTVEGQTYEVSVEEISDHTAAAAVKSQPGTKTSPGAEIKPEPVKSVPEPVVTDRQAPASSGGSGGTAVSAPMPGSIIDVLVGTGDYVKDGQVLLILEAMKMENEITSTQSGTVIEVLVKKGDTVNSGDPLVVIG